MCLTCKTRTIRSCMCYLYKANLCNIKTKSIKKIWHIELGLVREQWAFPCVFDFRSKSFTCLCPGVGITVKTNKLWWQVRQLKYALFNLIHWFHCIWQVLSSRWSGCSRYSGDINIIFPIVLFFIRMILAILCPSRDNVHTLFECRAARTTICCDSWRFYLISTCQHQWDFLCFTWRNLNFLACNANTCSQTSILVILSVNRPITDE